MDITMPADVPAAAEDTSEAPAVDVSSQHSIHDENGYYVYNGTKNDTYNSLTKDGLWVGGVDDNTGFHVDNKGHASANGLDVQNQKITGVAGGEFKSGSTEAVTAGQLYDAGIVPGKAADGSVAIGNGSNVMNINGVAIGNKALVNYSVENGVAIGQGAEVRTDNATAIGQGSRVVSGDGSVALGQGSMVTATDAKSSDPHGVVSVGLTGNKVTEGFTRRIINVADGINDSDAATYGQVKDVDAKLGDLDFSDTHSLKKAENVTDALTKLDTKAYNLSGKIDDFSRSGIMAGGTLDSRNAGTNSIQLGNQARAAGQNSIAFGAGASVTGENTEESILTRAKNNGVAIGYSATAAGFNTTVLGAAAKAQGDNATALGQGTLVAAANSVALGAGSRVTTDDIRDSDTNGVVSVGKSDGERRIINVADGVNDSDAATYGQVKDVQSSVTALDNLAVKYDTADKTSVTFNRDNKAGSVLNNVNDIVMQVETYNPSGKVSGYKSLSFKEAGIIPGTVSGDDNTDSVVIGRDSKSSKKHSVVVGDGARTLGMNATAIGTGASAEMDSSVAIGSGSQVGTPSAVNGTAVGAGSKVTAKNGTAVGQGAFAWGTDSTVLGASARVERNADGSVALGKDSYAKASDILDSDTKGVVSVGKSGNNGFTRRIINVADGVNDSDAATVKQVKAVQGDVDELNELAVTYTDNTKKAVNFNGATLKNVGDIQIGTAQSTFVGSGLVNGKVYDTGAGQWAENGANATHSMAVGSKSSVRGKDSIAVGPEATVNNGNSVVLEQSTAVGSKATVTSSFSTALGANTQATGDYSVAIGAQSRATVANATAIGAYAAAGENSVVVGGGSKELAAPIVSKSNGTAMGTYVDVNAENGTALGYGSQIGWNGKNSVALGADSVANEENVVSVGHTKGQANGFGGNYGEDLNRRITNVADGKNANDAATVGQISKITGMDSEKGNVVQYDGEDKSVVTFAGENGTKLTNLAAGEFKADSTDAVTAGQLYASGIVPGSIVDGSGTGKGNMALGNMSEIEAGDGMDYNTAIGYNAGISREYVIGKGYENAENSTAIGASARIYGSDSVAVGHQSSVTHKQGVAIGQGAKVESANSVAVGHEAIIKGNAENSIAIGNSKTYDPETGLGGGATQSVASGAKNSTVIGVGGATTSEGAVVLGYEARVNGSAANATAIGKDATIQVSSGNGNVALGAESEVSKADVGDDTAHGVVSIGKSGDDGFTRRIVNVADGLNDSDAATVGQLNAMQSAYTDSGIVGGTMDKNTLATGAVAIGKDSNVHGTGSIAIGTGSKVEKYNSVAIGRNAIVKGAGSVALGASSVATEDNVLSLGRNDGSLGLRIVNMKDGINERDAVTVGQMNALALGDRNGSLSLKNGATNLADGIDRNTTAIKSLDEQLDDVKVDWGESTQSMKELTEKASAFAAQTQNVDWNALNSVDWNAVNAMAAVPATMNLAIDDAQANEGTGAEKDDDDRSPQTNGSNPGKVDGNLHVSGNTTLDGTLNVKGDATFEGNATFDKGATMKGDLNMSGNKITGLGAGDVSADSTDAVNGSQLFDVQQQVSDNRNAIGALGSRVSDLGEEVDSVGAISAALAGLHPLDYNGTGSKFQISAALGTYDGTQAAAIGGFYHFNRDTLLSIGGSTSFEGDRKTAANVGVTFRVGEGASEAPAVQDTETKQQMEAMKQEIEMLKAELEQLKNKDTEGTNDKK
ncbi:YadA-like family protein [Megasphaera hexanoica]|nr:YadA-like family protein [Megasphaera hexanoica]